MTRECPTHGAYDARYQSCPRCIDGAQRCHAVRCRKRIPARHFMCAMHWAILPEAEQQRLGERFDPEQYYTGRVSREWMRQAMRCKLLVAEHEGLSVDLLETHRYTVQYE